MQKIQQGFTLIELMIVVAIIGILAAVAIPNYQNYTKKAKFTEVVNAAAPYKTAIDICAQSGDCVSGGAISGAGLGSFGIPPTQASTYVASVAVSSAGVITVTPNAVGGIVATDTFVLTPTYAAGQPVTWAVSGGCKSSAGGAIC